MNNIDREPSVLTGDLSNLTDGDLAAVWRVQAAADRLEAIGNKPKAISNSFSRWIGDWATQGINKGKMQFVGLVGSATMFLGAATVRDLDSVPKVSAQVSCDPSKYATMMENNILALVSDCEGIIAYLGSADYQEGALTERNVVTTALGDARNPYAWINGDFLQFRLDSVSGSRMNDDNTMLKMLPENSTTNEGRERLLGLQQAQDFLATQQIGRPVSLAYNNASVFYPHDQERSAKIADLTYQTIEYYGVDSSYISPRRTVNDRTGKPIAFTGRITHDAGGNPVTINELQTGIRSSAGPNGTLATRPINIDGTEYIVSVEEDAERDISLIPNEITRHRIRSTDLPITNLLIPSTDLVNSGFSINDYLFWTVADKSCGNFITMFPIPFRPYHVPEIPEQPGVPTPVIYIPETPTPEIVVPTLPPTPEIVVVTATPVPPTPEIRVVTATPGIPTPEQITQPITVIVGAPVAIARSESNPLQVQRQEVTIVNSNELNQFQIQTIINHFVNTPGIVVVTATPREATSTPLRPNTQIPVATLTTTAERATATPSRTLTEVPSPTRTATASPSHTRLTGNTQVPVPTLRADMGNAEAALILDVLNSSKAKYAKDLVAA